MGVRSKAWLEDRRLRLAQALRLKASVPRDSEKILAASARNAGEHLTAKRKEAAKKLSASAASQEPDAKKRAAAAATSSRSWEVIKRARQTASRPQLAVGFLPSLLPVVRLPLSLAGRLCFVDSSAKLSPICTGGGRPQIEQAVRKQGAKTTTDSGLATCFVVDDVNHQSQLVLWNSRLRGVPLINEAHARSGQGPAVSPVAAVAQGDARVHISAAFKREHPALSRTARHSATVMKAAACPALRWSLLWPIGGTRNGGWRRAHGPSN